jgi:hypothetical protein
MLAQHWPTAMHKNWDFRDFGDMFFVFKEDPLEVYNKIGEKQYMKDIKRLRNYYDDFVKNIPSTGKDEWVQQKL